MKRIIFLMFVVFLAVSFFISCDEPDNPVPSLTQISPSEAYAGSAAFTMTLVGSGFVSNSKVIFNGGEKATTYVSDTELTAQIELSRRFAITDINNPAGSAVSQSGIAVMFDTYGNPAMAGATGGGVIGDSYGVPGAVGQRIGHAPRRFHLAGPRTTGG